MLLHAKFEWERMVFEQTDFGIFLSLRSCSIYFYTHMCICMSVYILQLQEDLCTRLKVF